MSVFPLDPEAPHGVCGSLTGNLLPLSVSSTLILVLILLVCLYIGMFIAFHFLCIRNLLCLLAEVTVCINLHQHEICISSQVSPRQTRPSLDSPSYAWYLSHLFVVSSHPAFHYPGVSRLSYLAIFTLIGACILQASVCAEISLRMS